MSLTPYIGPATILQLYRAVCAQGVDTLYHMSVHDLVSCGVSEHTARRVYAGLRDQKTLDHEMHAIKRVKAQYVTIADAAYPTMLWHTTTPPPVLYYQGASLDVVSQSIACIGSRRSSLYARRAAERILPEISRYGYSIVSGGAHGADTIAHQVTLEHHGTPVAVLGSGLGCPYPERNASLFHRIRQQGGVIVSPFAIDTPARSYHFPIRNRIIAGLSRAVLVLQAARKSGTRITASYALEDGRDVAAVPGPIEDPLSQGVHALIQEGAHLATSGADVLRMCDHTYTPYPVQENRGGYQAAYENTDPLVALCHTPQHFDTLLQETGLSYDQLQQRLMQLHIAGTLIQDASGCWRSA